jgi:hypothetical protein
MVLILNYHPESFLITPSLRYTTQLLKLASIQRFHHFLMLQINHNYHPCLFDDVPVSARSFRGVTSVYSVLLPPGPTIGLFANRHAELSCVIL